MRKFIVLLLSMIALYNLSSGQTGFSLSGSVVDENKQPLTGATVVLSPTGEGITSDSRGQFVITGLAEGKYTIEISFIGYNSVRDTITLDKDKSYHATLKMALLTLQEVVISNNNAETRKKEESLNIEIVNDDYLKQNLGGSLMKSLERLPGVTAIDIGSGQSKPVIRGLGFNRVVVVENNIKHEAQQWGADHGLEIDQYAVDMIEVIKGPASIIYGSDAIGGVINMRSRPVPADHSVGGNIDLSYKSNSGSVGGSVSLYGRKDWFFADLRFTLLDYGDYKVPTDSIDIYSYRAALYRHHMRNTAGQELSLNVNFGIILPKFQSRFYVSELNGKSGFFANAHGLEPRNVDTDLHDKSNRDIQFPYHKVKHFKVISKNQYTLEKMRIEADLGFQRNFRQEWSEYVNHGYMPPLFPDTMGFSPDLERQFEKFVYSGNLRFAYDLTDKTYFIAGINSEYQDNRIDGRAFIIPAFQQFALGSFVLVKYAFTEKSILQAAVRYDLGRIQTQEYYDWFPSPMINNGDTTWEYLQRAAAIERNFNNVSWSVGYNYNPGNWSFKANLGKSFRMPIAKELAANGVNYHTFSYEVGDAGLSPEVSYQLDAGVEYGSDKFAIGATPFVNYFRNYIYLNPTSEYDRLYGNGNQVFYYTQARVFRYGIEIHAHYQLIKCLQLGLIGEYVHSEQLSGEKRGYTLPFSPPASAIINAKYQRQKIGFIRNGYLSADYRIVATQNNIVPPEEITKGYQVVNIRFGGDIRLKDHFVSVSMQVQNLLNNKYYNHTSYYRLLNVPEPGTNFIINVSVPFRGRYNPHPGPPPAGGGG